MPINPDRSHPALNPWVIEGKVIIEIPYREVKYFILNLKQQVGKHVYIRGNRCLNLATHNYLGFVESQEINDSAVECINKYGVGSCGPRGFYGTVGVYSNKYSECLLYSFEWKIDPHLS